MYFLQSTIAIRCQNLRDKSERPIKAPGHMPAKNLQQPKSANGSPPITRK